MPKNNKNVWVAMSGGVDSSVAALLLKRAGYRVTGVYMKNWSDPLADECPWEEDVKDFYAVCKKLRIPHRVETFEEEYRQRVVDYLIRGYQQGITPNPDMLCNREIKFKVFLEKAKSLGADLIATGHYVIKKTDRNGIHHLYQAKDTNKDQSYFLALLNQQQVRCSLFPIGHYTKPEVRQIAKRAQLPVYNKPDSQGICFIGKVKFKDFIRQFIKAKQGPIMTTEGETVGQHDGITFYTIGQRHGLKIGGGIPYFVTGKNKRTNALIVARGEGDSNLFSREITVKNFSWIEKDPPAGQKHYQARIRYRQPLQSCTFRKQGSHLLVRFTRPQRAVTPGQFLVLYHGKQMLGGGVIL